MPRSQKNITFINFVNKKYRKELELAPTAVKFYYWDDYAIWLWLKKFKEDDDKYYEALEQDIKEYSDLQTGIEE